MAAYWILRLSACLALVAAPACGELGPANDPAPEPGVDVADEPEPSPTEPDESNAPNTPAGRLLELVPDPSTNLSYTATASGTITLSTVGERSAEAPEDVASQNADGTWGVSGRLGGDPGDSFRFEGSITAFSPMEGPFQLYLDGVPITAYELTGTQKPADPPPAPDDDPLHLGGGAGYPNVVRRTQATVVVSTLSALKTALANAKSGDIVYLDDAADLRLTYADKLSIPAGATLASGRGVDGSMGARIRTTDSCRWSDCELILMGTGSRLTGLRVAGPRWNYDGSIPAYPSGAGVSARADLTEIDNVEIYGFAAAAIRTGGRSHIHHSHIHHNPGTGLGYGVTGGSGMATIEYNKFDANRHSVAQSGAGGFIVRYNHFGPLAFGQVIDCHKRDGDNSTAIVPGCTTIEVHHNTIEAVKNAARPTKYAPGFLIRGAPSNGAHIHHNWFYNPKVPRTRPDPTAWTDEAIVQRILDNNTWIRVRFDNNHYGSSTPSRSDIGLPR